MGRDLKYRIIYKPELLSTIEDIIDKRDTCEQCYFTRCEDCEKRYVRIHAVVWDWQDVYGFSRHNDVLGYCFERRFTKTELREFITELVEEASPETMLETTEACNALRQILERIHYDNWLVDICYD
jgi:hypothetical protein